MTRSDTGPDVLVVVHGPLRRRGSQVRVMEGAEYLCTVGVPGTLYAAGRKAYLHLEPSNRPVKCELFRVSAAHFEELNRLQQAAGHSSVSVPLAGEGESQHATVWVWTHPLDGAGKVASGDWMDHAGPLAPPYATGAALIIPLFPIAAFALSISSPPRSVDSKSYASLLIFLIFAGPLAGWLALYYGRRWRERWVIARILAVLLYVLWSLGALFMAAVMAMWGGDGAR